MFDLNAAMVMQEPATEPYSSIQEMVLSFDKRILQATFKVLILIYLSIFIFKSKLV